HDTTCARTHGLNATLDRLSTTLGVPTLTDLGYEDAGGGLPSPGQEAARRPALHRAETFNKVIRGIHGVSERANALLKVTFKALRRVSLDPGSITRIARAALVLLQLEHGRTT
ncbi:transposase family protein, partial [Streptomyces cyaneofuscatus]